MSLSKDISDFSTDFNAATGASVSWSRGAKKTFKHNSANMKIYQEHQNENILYVSSSINN